MSPANPFFQPFRFIATDVVDVPLGPAFLRQLGSHPVSLVPSGVVCAAGGVMVFMMVVTCWLAWVLRNKDAKKPTICDALGASIIFERAFRAAMPWTAITSIASPETEEAKVSKSEENFSLNQDDHIAPSYPVRLDTPWPQIPLAETFAEDIVITSTPQAKLHSTRGGCDVHVRCVRPKRSAWLGIRTTDSVSANLLSQDETVTSHETLETSVGLTFSEVSAMRTPKQSLGKQIQAGPTKSHVVREQCAHIGTKFETRRVLSSADEQRRRHWHAHLMPKCSIYYVRAVKTRLARKFSRITLQKLCSYDWAEWSVEDKLPARATCGGYSTLRKAFRMASSASLIPRGVLVIAGRAMYPRRQPPILVVEDSILKALLLHLTSEGLPASGLLGFSGVLRLDETIFRSIFGACYVSREDGAISFASRTGCAGQFSDNSHVEVNVSRDEEPPEQSSSFIRESDAQFDRDTIDGELQADDINFYFSPADGPVLNKLLRKHGILAWKVLHMNMFPWGAAFTLRLMLHNPATWWSGFKQEYIAGIAAVAPNDPTAHRVLWLKDHAVGVRLDCWEVWTQYVVRNPRSPFVFDVWEEQRKECRRRMEDDMARRFG